MSDYTATALRFVIEKMPKESIDALMKFTERNPRWRGAGWDDCLDILLDSDSHLDVTEPIMDRLLTLNPELIPTMICAVTITLLYASRAFAESTVEAQATQVVATLHNNGGA